MPGNKSGPATKNSDDQSSGTQDMSKIQGMPGNKSCALWGRSAEAVHLFLAFRRFLRRRRFFACSLSNLASHGAAASAFSAFFSRFRTRAGGYCG
jgi:hypothetical protein